MDIIDTAEMPWGENLAAQRAGGMAHKRLFEGEEGSPDNYLLVLARESSDYFSPRHRHAWDQVRFCLEGAIPIGKGLAVEAGEIAYFPEAAPYGPQEGGPDRIVLLLQFGGASGQGYIGVERLNRAREEMQRFGHFEKGVFKRSAGEGRANQDAYEAIWQHVTGHPLAYAEPAFKAPVVMRPAGFAWKDVAGEPGVDRKTVGVFPGRGLEISFLSLDPGAQHDLAPSPALRFIFVCEGAGSFDDQPFAAQTVMRLHPGESSATTAQDKTILLMLSVLPVGAA